MNGDIKEWIDNPDAYKRDMLDEFNKFIRAIKDEFQTSPDDLEKETFQKIFTIALDIGAITQAVIGEKLGYYPSTTIRWKNGETIPSKRKQMIVLDLIRERTSEMIGQLEHLIEEKRLSRAVGVN